jgi:hypothetical protein
MVLLMGFMQGGSPCVVKLVCRHELLSSLCSLSTRDPGSLINIAAPRTQAARDVSLELKRKTLSFLLRVFLFACVRPLGLEPRTTEV